MHIQLGLIVLFLFLYPYKLGKPILNALLYALIKSIWLLLVLFFFRTTYESLIILFFGVFVSFAISWFLGWVVAWLQAYHRKSIWAHFVSAPILLILMIV